MKLSSLIAASTVGAIVALSCIGPVAAQEPTGRSPIPERLSSPAAAHSQLSRLTSDEAGNLYLSWVTRRGDTAALAFASFNGTGWSAPATISEGADWFLNWADFPRLSVHDGSMVAHWLRRSGDGGYDYDVVTSFHDAAQRRWRDGTVLNTDGVRAEHGFVSMTPTETNRTLITWLDGRRTKREPDAAPMTLRGAEFTGAGERLAEWELDARVCDCCQTAAAMTSRGPVVVYRDRSPDEIRDIAIVRRVDGEWTQPRTLHGDGWQVAGCPVNGPAIAARADDVAVVWYTARDGVPKVQLAVSRDAGEHFGAPTLIAGPDTLGRVDVTLLADGDIVASWLDTGKQDTRIMLSRFSTDGVFIDAVEVAATLPSRRSGFPAIEGVGNTVYVTWTDISDTPRVNIARVRYGGAP
ncbi:MAG: hypothetical protein V2I24_12515 [Halieaceae bacterium]|jgi:hypothetical protein|nr:hypothetical protein [Halieaceae bacterium]